MTTFNEWMKPSEGMQPKLEYPMDIDKTGSIVSTELKSFKSDKGNDSEKCVVGVILDGETQSRGLIIGKQKAREFSAMVDNKTPDKWVGIKIRTIPYSVTYDGKQFMKVGLIPA